MRLMINKSMKNIYIMGLLLAFSGFAMAETATQQPAEQPVRTASNPNAIRIVTRPEIMGLWGMEIPNNKKCVEYYNFRSSNDVVIKSGEEWSYGIYEYQPSDDPKEQLSALVMQIKFDNNKVDCSGQQQDQTGDVSQYFVQWKNDHTINFCSTAKGEQCFATLRRMLP
ncbi:MULTISPECIES: hypothetical protein [Acinetobacter]|uniref:hypothetical protein n=1 Tax=Acinetobacter TaxID=469 RepID=UPI00083AC3F3|nr:hypothetical protein [Acinetobacter seifertii]OCZ59866.1 hypothetical protein A7P21_00080 [Acinetobacter seifertii]QNX88966.1 hypothetical protein IC772_07690 [Acinetobacter seifertii]